MKYALIIILALALAVIAFLPQTINALITVHNAVYATIGQQDKQFVLQLRGEASATPSPSVVIFPSPSATATPSTNPALLLK